VAGPAIYKVATLAINTYTITATAGAGGSITPAGAVVVNYGSNQAFAISASTGTTLPMCSWMCINGCSGSYIFSNVTAGHTINCQLRHHTGTMNIWLSPR